MDLDTDQLTDSVSFSSVDSPGTGSVASRFLLTPNVIPKRPASDSQKVEPLVAASDSQKVEPLNIVRDSFLVEPLEDVVSKPFGVS